MTMLNQFGLKSIINILILGALTATVGSTTAQAQWGGGRTEKTASEYVGESWNRGFYFPFVDGLAHVPTMGMNSTADQAGCARFYSRINQTHQIKIIMGLGYYDFSEGEPFTAQYRDDYGQLQTADFGMNATVDNAYVTMYASLFTRRCHGRLQVCGFSQQSPTLFTKTVRSPSGDRVQVTLEMKNGSLTEQNTLNVGPLRDQQAAKSDTTTRWFFGSIPSADLVIYNGHSRKGGGPDFSPPKLLRNLHVNYGYYAATTPGLKRLLDALNGSEEKPAALMLMSCNSTKLFASPIARVAPQTSFTGTDEVIPGDIPQKGALAGIDSMLRFQCEEGFNAELSSTPEIQQHLTHLSFK